MATRVKAKIWFIHRPGLKWTLLRLLVNSPWEDVAIEISGRVYCVDKLHGVTRYGSDEFHLKYRNKTWTIVDVPDIRMAEFYLNDQIGKPSDSSALSPVGIFRRWDDDQRWYSSELVAETLILGKVFIYPKIGRVTPRRLWHLLPTVVVRG